MVGCGCSFSPGLLLAACVVVPHIAAVNLLKQDLTQPTDDTFLREYVYVDTENAYHAHAKGHHVLIGPDQVPFLTELSHVLLERDGVRKEHQTVYPNSTAIYLGVNGSCQVELIPKAEVAAMNISIKRGRSVTIFPGVKHRAFLPGKRDFCKLVYIHVKSGDYSWSQLQDWITADYDALVDEPTAHDDDKLSKRVFLRAGVVPGIFQLSIARFAPGAVCPEHSHKSASEVYINYYGPGCHMSADGPQGRERNFDLTGGRVAVLNPGTNHSAWNNHKNQPCWNVNMMIGDPNVKALSNNHQDKKA